MRFPAPIVLLALLSGCAGVPAGDDSARTAFAEIEAAVLATRVLRVNYEIEARGAIEASQTGDLVLQKPAMAAIDSAGVFAGAAVRPQLVSDGIRLRGGAEPKFFERPLPADLHSGLLLGLTRMGVLHNLAMLTQGAPPDGTDGAVREWVVPGAFVWQAQSRRIDGVAVRGIGFDIAVGGRPAGKAVLWYDPESRLPVAREQLVRFDSGDMRVIERYEIETDGMIGPCRFDLDTVPAG